jgi:hypothetical protein
MSGADKAKPRSIERGRRLSLRGVIAEECANYFSTDPGYRSIRWCEARQAPCRPLGNPPTPCGYFQEAVLPAWPDIAGEYVALVRQRPGIAVTRRAVCRNCDEAFKTTSNRQQYCSEACQSAGRKRYVREYRRKERASCSAPVLPEGLCSLLGQPQTRMDSGSLRADSVLQV